jgi:hypothetical protein
LLKLKLRQSGQRFEQSAIKGAEFGFERLDLSHVKRRIAFNRRILRHGRKITKKRQQEKESKP